MLPSRQTSEITKLVYPRGVNVKPCAFVNYLSKDEIIEAVSCAGCHEVAYAVKPNTKKSVEISGENKKALQLFKELQIITDYSENTETGILYILK